MLKSVFRIFFAAGTLAFSSGCGSIRSASHPRLAATQDFTKPEFWNKTYSAPPYFEVCRVVIESKDAAATEAFVTAALWKAGGVKAPIQHDPYFSQYPYQEFVRGYSPGRATYDGFWKVPLPQYKKVLGLLLGLRRVRFASSKKLATARDVEDLYYKLDRIQAEISALKKEQIDIPGIIGFSETVAEELAGLISRYEKAQKAGVAVRVEQAP
ncbi:MAG: hypothetical protein HY927_11530 [Elusimicrobia bacterium]|nr:hypothetical protein [Elusimicrobiota bacterium]